MNVSGATLVTEVIFEIKMFMAHLTRYGGQKNKALDMFHGILTKLWVPTGNGLRGVLTPPPLTPKSTGFFSALCRPGKNTPPHQKPQITTNTGGNRLVHCRFEFTPKP